MEEFEDINEYLEERGTDESNLSRRKFLAAAGTAGAAGLSGCLGTENVVGWNIDEAGLPRPQFTDWGRFRVLMPGGLPFGLEEDIPLATYSSNKIENTARSIHDRAERDITNVDVREVPNKILMETFYFTDEQVLEALPGNSRLVGDRDQISRLIGNKHYATMKMGIKAGGATRDIRQYLEKDLRSEYIDNIGESFRDAFSIAYELGEPVFDIGGADERDDQIIGMELYMLGNGGSLAGRYFNTTEIQRYGEGSVSRLVSDLEEEAEEPGGFEFYI